MPVWLITHDSRELMTILDVNRFRAFLRDEEGFDGIDTVLQDVYIY